MTPEAEPVIWIEATDDDLRQAMQNALDEAGLTLEEVQEQQRRGVFSSDDARMAAFVANFVVRSLEKA